MRVDDKREHVPDRGKKDGGGWGAKGPTPRFEADGCATRVCRVSRLTVRARAARA